MILDHYSTTQGRRVLRMIQAEPLALLEEMWRAFGNLEMTMWQIARSLGLLRTENGREAMSDNVRSEMILEAYQALYPAVETPAADEMTRAQRQKLYGWLASFAPAGSA